MLFFNLLSEFIRSFLSCSPSFTSFSLGIIWTEMLLLKTLRTEQHHSPEISSMASLSISLLKWLKSCFILFYFLINFLFCSTDFSTGKSDSCPVIYFIFLFLTGGLGVVIPLKIKSRIQVTVREQNTKRQHNCWCDSRYNKKYLIIIIMEICKEPTLWLKALNKHTHIMYIEMENVIPKKEDTDKGF